MSRTSFISCLFAIGSMLFAAACVNSSGPHDESAESADQLQGQNGSKGQHPHKPPPPPPPPCESEDECVEHCPPDAMGCACVELPKGGNGCIPTCDEDADCPVAPEGLPPLSCHEGICVPPPPPPGGSCSAPPPPPPPPGSDDAPPPPPEP